MDLNHLALAEDRGPLGPLSLTVEVTGEPVLVGQDYLLLERIGAGGMGEVFRARQLSTGRDVAVKRLRQGRPDQRFAQEAAALARLNHPGIVRLLQAGQHEGRPFLVLELVVGSSLAEVLGNGPMLPREAAGAVREAAEAMASAHALGVIHRDLKPSNLLRDSAGRVRVTDFGLAKDLHFEADLTLTGDHLGTPAYMAPEQVDPRLGELGPRADVYSLGATLFHLLTGRLPFAGTTPAEILHQVATLEPDWRTGWERIHRDLRTICQRALARELTRRYATMTEFGADLGRFLAGEPVLARPPGVAERVGRTLRKRGVLTALAALVLGALLTVMALPVRQRSQVAALVRDWPLASPQALHVLATPGGTGSGRFVSFSDTNGMMALGAGGRRVRIAGIDPWRVRVGGLVFSNRVSFHRFQPGEPILLAAEETGRWKIVRVDPVFLDGVGGHLDTNVTAVAYSREGHHWALGSAAGEVDVRAFTQRRFRRPFQTRLDGPVTALQFDVTARRLLAASARHPVGLWDLATQTQLQTWPVDGLCVGAGFLADDSLVYVATVYGRRSSITRLFRVADGSSVATNHFWGELTGLLPSPDNTRLVVRSKKRWAEIWNAADLSTLAQTSEHPETITTAEFSADGLRLLTVDATGSARIWDAHTGAPLTEFWRGPTGIQQAAFAPDGVRVGTGDAGPTGTLWDAGCPIPAGWDHDALRRALLHEGSLPALRRAAWLRPSDGEVVARLAEATAAQGTAVTFQREAEFLRRRAATLK